MSKAAPKRAVKGTIDSALLLRLPDELRSVVKRLAKRAGLSMSEWLRLAAHEKAQRDGK